MKTYRAVLTSSELPGTLHFCLSGILLSLALFEWSLRQKGLIVGQLLHQSTRSFSFSAFLTPSTPSCRKQRNSTHARNHRKARQAHMKKMVRIVRNEDAFTQRFRSGKGVFFRFWGHSRLWPQNQKKVSPDPFHKNMVRKVYTAKISGPYQLFHGSGPIFLCSVNGA